MTSRKNKAARVADALDRWSEAFLWVFCIVLFALGVSYFA